jgi:hypothetical protein
MSKSWANVVAGADSETNTDFVNLTNNSDEMVSSVEFPTLSFSQEDSKKLKHNRFVSQPTQMSTVNENPTSTLTRTLTNLRNQKHDSQPKNTYKDKLSQRPKVKNPFKGRKPEDNESTQSESKPTRFNTPKNTSDNKPNQVFKDFHRKQQDSSHRRVSKPAKSDNQKPVRRMKYTNEARRSQNNEQSKYDRNGNDNRGQRNGNDNRGQRNGNDNRGQRNGNDNRSRRVRTTLEIFGDREPQPPREETRISYDDLVQNQGRQRQSNPRSQRDRQVLLSDFL